MNKLLGDLVDEIQSVTKNNTLDSIIPSIVFIIAYSFGTLVLALISIIVISVGIVGYRIIKKQKYLYSLLGFFFAIIISGYTYVSGRAENYFLAGMIGNSILVLAMTISLLLKKPFAAFVSHFTRGWELSWFWRNDIRPAYQEVTLMWVIFISARLAIQVSLYNSGQVLGLFWVRLLLGTPAMVVVLCISYIYGIYRLKILKGPGIDEFREKKSKPWRGQIKGF